MNEHAELDGDTLAMLESIAVAGVPDVYVSTEFCRSTPRHRQRGRARRAARRQRKTSSSDDEPPSARVRCAS